ncbi:hypothetical protein OKA04_22535 [Luteolibacter flavescens]|uniref:Uncharacterized protein n=1 Tax=Luteolibacter flavescens TaxID=1859460 RepID=A0ABT3FVB0_9BACT|nr:hypothetical protein [Luteolibacter flavescens]MCW1887531.1 hypothetical protein [Luteolibacter flavescens]
MSAKKAPAKKTSAKEAAKRSSTSSQGSPDMKDVVTLATSLVSAQIVASSYHTTAIDMLQELRQVVLDAIESLNDVRSAGEVSSDFQFAMDIMNKTRLDRRRMRRLRLLEPMSHPDLDRMFQSAMRRAFVMLNAPFDPERIVFAEQIFRPDEILTEGAIRKRLIDFEWPGLKSADSVIRLMRDVNFWFYTHLDELRSSHRQEDGVDSVSATDPTIPIDVRIESEAEKLMWLLQQPSGEEPLEPSRSSYRDLSAAVSNFINSRNGMDFGGASRTFDAIERNNLIMVMFGDRGPRSPREDNAADGDGGLQEGAPSTLEASSASYRPWAIFRYLRRHGRKPGDELGNDLNLRIRSKRSDLNKKLIPDIRGVMPAGFDFGPLHEEAENLVSQLHDDESYSDSAMTSDELEIHGLDPADVAESASEFDDGDSDEGIPRF